MGGIIERTGFWRNRQRIRRRIRQLGPGALVLVPLLTLAACGDGGGGTVNSGGSTPPPASNTSLASLTVSQSFTNNAATQTANFALGTGNTNSGSSDTQALVISYDATNSSYTISTQGRSATFAPADLVSQASGVAVYSKTKGNTTDRLTNLAANVTGYDSAGPKYSGLAYWQRYTVDGTSEATTFDIFTYGLDTPATGVPRTGQAAYNTTVFGLVTVPGSEPRLIQGYGRFDVSFVDGVFTTSAATTEKGLVTGNAYAGDTIGIAGSGALSSTNGTFSGTVTYAGSGNGSTGSLAGRFYGPTGQELGAEFTTNGTDGSAASGAIWGIKSTSLTPLNLTLANLATDQTFTAASAQVVTGGSGSTAYANTDSGTTQAALTTAGGIALTPVNSSMTAASFAKTDAIIASDPNFASYRKTENGLTRTLDTYTPGSANKELALTYLTFARWRDTPVSPTGVTSLAQYSVYGLGTPAIAIAARTGSAHYAGFAYGTAYDGSNATGAAVKGAASFDVSFALGGYSGSIALKNSATDYGTFNVSGTIESGLAQVGTLTGVTAGSGRIGPSFYGPKGQEFGGPFLISVPNGTGTATTTIVGAAVAKGG